MTATRKTIYIKGMFDGNGGVQDLTVSKLETYNEVGTLFDKEILFKGNIAKLSERDIDEEIENALKSRFSIEGYETVLSID